MKSFACQNAVSVFVFACAFRPRADRFGPSMLVLSPTRELAQQIQAEVNKYSYKGITSVCVYGGGDRQTQVRAFGKGVEIVIGKFLHNVIRMLKEMYVNSRLSVWYLCTSDVHSHLNTTKQRCFYAPGYCILSLICLSFGFQINISISWKCECQSCCLVLTRVSLTFLFSYSGETEWPSDESCCRPQIGYFPGGSDMHRMNEGQS